MKRGTLKRKDAEIHYSLLKDNAGQWRQCFYSIIPKKTAPITKQIKTIELAESKLFNTLKINKDCAVVKRFFSSDLINHYDEIIKYKNRQGTDFFMSLTEQPPVSSIKVALLGMCLNNIIKGSKSREGQFFYFDTESGIRHIFAEHLVDSEADENSSSEEQTKKLFCRLQDKLAEFNCSIEDSVLRTWIYTPNVDADYPGIVKARKEFFDSIGLTKYTHYLASTGIQGGAVNRFARVFMDAYAVAGVSKGKIRYIQSPEHLGPTHVYGVTFERATAVEMGKADYLFISGTASIDKKGAIVHPGDIAKQTKRTLRNISALLKSARFTKKDLSSFMVYLRDPADYGFVYPLIAKYLKNLPIIYVKAPVCRPGWLIEIEATAAKIIV